MKIDSRNRRMLLQGLGGAFLAVPFLSSLIPRPARAQLNPELKYIQLVTSESGHKASNSPMASKMTNLDADTKAANLSDIVSRDGRISANFGKGFNQYADKINIISNTNCYSFHTLHNECVHTTASGVVKQSRTEPRNPFSMDYRIEQNIYGSGAQPPIRALRMNLEPISSEGSAQYKSSCAYDGQGPIANPITSLAALKNAVGLAFSNQSDAPVEVRTSRRDLLGAVLADFNRVMNSRRISSEDKRILEAAMDSYSSIQKNEQSSQSLTCSMPASGVETNYLDKHKRAIDILVAALSCGVTRVVTGTIYQGEDKVFSRPAIHGRHHARVDDKINDFMRWRSQVVLYFIERLAATPSTTGGTLLDDSLLYYGQEFADVNTAHQTQGYTSLLAGGAAGKIQTGLHIDAGGAPLGRTMITVMQAFGLSTPQIEAGGGVGFGEYSPNYKYGSSGFRDYDKALTSRFFTNAEKRKALPILIG